MTEDGPEILPALSKLSYYPGQKGVRQVKDADVVMKVRAIPRDTGEEEEEEQRHCVFSNSFPSWFGREVAVLYVRR